MGKKEVEVSYVVEDVHCQTFDIHKGAVFLVIDGNKRMLKGFHKGGTDSLKKLERWPDWDFERKLAYYKVPEKCHICKYCHYTEKGWHCIEYSCVLEN